VEPASTPRPLVQKKTMRDSIRIDILLSAVSILAVAQSSSEVPEGLMNNPVYYPIRGQNYFYVRGKTVYGSHLWHIYWAVLIASRLTHLPFDGTFEM